MPKTYLDLAQLQEMIKEGVADLFPDKMWVRAEISQWSPRANGHCYLSLSQSSLGRVVAEARAMIWKWHYPRLKDYFEQTAGQPLGAGITVLVRVQVNYSELYGISLFIDEIDPAFTLGEKALERKRAVERLTAGGYMDMQKELVLPRLPYRLAVISSRTAAGYEDFCRHLLGNDRGYAFHVDLFEALMQGEAAPASIIAALLDAGEKGYDALLLLRGGGSELDLACFDDFDLAVAIATAPVPVVTAIGHDRDNHIADMVANASVKTPTALADLFLDRHAAEEAQIDALGARILSAARHLAGEAGLRTEALHSRVRLALLGKLASEQQRTDALSSRIRLSLTRKATALDLTLRGWTGRIVRALDGKLAGRREGTDRLGARIRLAATARLGQEISRLALGEARIAGADPRRILSLGYVLVSDDRGRVLKGVGPVREGDTIGVRFSDGALKARVDRVYKQADQNKTNIA